jgi:tRNA U34 5-methylaminomethyl-2-thiouridine-forming methyltransferase MnmC
MDKIITADGSETFLNETVGETYHPRLGTMDEEVEKYVVALDVVSGKVIFDVCFGLGYLTAAALDVGPVTVYCFENDEEIMRKVLEVNPTFEKYGLIKEFIRGFFGGKDVYEKDGVKLVMMFGDARKTINEMKEKADYVFFAPFSPAKAPDMWTEEFFSDIRKKMKDGGKLATFSYARIVRDNLKKAGFSIRDGPIRGRRSPSVIAENTGS